MKIFPLLLSAAALFAAGCETPEPVPGTVDHQLRLHEEARANFLAMKAEERARRGLAEPSRPVLAEEPQIGAMEQPRRAEKLYRARLAPLPPARRMVIDDTIYEPTEAGLAEQREWELRRAREYAAYEAREARRFGKTPSQLTREERAIIRASAR